jgi:hypothetical protein
MALMKATVNSPTLSGTEVCSEKSGVGIIMKAMSVDGQVRELYGIIA